MASYRFSVEISFAIAIIFRSQTRITLINDFSTRIYIYNYVVPIVKDNTTRFHKQTPSSRHEYVYLFHNYTVNVFIASYTTTTCTYIIVVYCYRHDDVYYNLDNDSLFLTITY